jgi:hypothetical protein
MEMPELKSLLTPCQFAKKELLQYPANYTQIHDRCCCGCVILTLEEDDGDKLHRVHKYTLNL